MRRSWLASRAIPAAAVAVVGAVATLSASAATPGHPPATRSRGGDGVGALAGLTAGVGPIASQAGEAGRLPATGPRPAARSRTSRDTRLASVDSCSPGPVPTTTTTVPTSTTTTTVPTSTVPTTTPTSTTVPTTTTTTTTTVPATTTTTSGGTGSGLYVRAPSSKRYSRVASPRATVTSTTTLPPTSSSDTTTTVPSETTSSTLPSTSTTASPTPTTEPASVPVTPSASGAYYIIESNGGVHPYGGAGFFGSKAGKRLPAPVIGGSPTADGQGYWLATSKGGVYNFGDAHFYGSAVHVRGLQPIVTIAATPDGEGYWLVSKSGAVYNFGDADFCGSGVHLGLKDSVVGFASTPDGAGYWLVTAEGAVYNFGDAGSYGALTSAKPHAPIVGITATADGNGYWLTGSTGAVYNFGDAHFDGSPVHKRFPRPVVSLTTTPDGGGYWLATATGRVFDFGDARFSGSLAHTPPPKPITVVQLIRTSLAAPSTTTSPFPHGDFGFDISDYQCARGDKSSIQADVPAVSGFAVLQVTGWLDSSDNSCLASEAAWAMRSASSSHGPYSLYLFMNSPGNDAVARAQGGNGPAGSCPSLTGVAASSCLAYNYAYNGAKDALAYADQLGVQSSVWWLDIENDHLSSTAYSSFPASYWSHSTALNDQSIQGALDALHQAGLTVGIYSTSVQYPRIAGSFVPSGPRVPLWIAGVPWTNPPFSEKGLDAPSVLSSWCAGTATYTNPKTVDVFAGGIPWLLQETPGNEPSPYGLDPDYSC